MNDANNDAGSSRSGSISDARSYQKVLLMYQRCSLLIASIAMCTVNVSYHAKKEKR
jgi:hypothetical protein